MKEKRALRYNLHDTAKKFAVYSKSTESGRFKKRDESVVSILTYRYAHAKFLQRF